VDQLSTEAHRMEMEQERDMGDIWRMSEFIGEALKRKGVDREDLKAFMSKIFEIVCSRGEVDPVLMYLGVIEDLREIWTLSDHLPVHGAWHHALVPGIIIKCLSNSGNDLSDDDVREAMERGMMIPGGSCGFHGACGAALGVGIAVSIVGRTTPLHERERSIAMMVTSRALACGAKIEGTRCCPRATYSAFELASLELGGLGYALPLTGVRGRCRFHETNDDCIEERCPYFPSEDGMDLNNHPSEVR
jgi:hypothetical protein